MWADHEEYAFIMKSVYLRYERSEFLRTLEMGVGQGVKG